jgi:hypothetical protein
MILDAMERTIREGIRVDADPRDIARAMLEIMDTPTPLMLFALRWDYPDTARDDDDITDEWRIQIQAIRDGA